MTIHTAKKLLEKNGILWSQYFDLDFVEHHITVEGNEEIISAIKRAKKFLTTGK